ncbi:MAG TPA: alkaline phosphatase family protein [Polyangiaceae bacterium]|nr:alkaline phosphatase family protein [Polyangiaceae bacterium]
MVDLKNKIRHVVLLMFENRSFDHMLGDLQQLKSVDGIPANGPPRKITFEGVDYLQEPGAARILTSDLKHEAIDVATQLAQGNTGFIQDFVRAFPHASVDARREVMRYFALRKLPALHALAEAFTVCDRWFASVPGPTWPNRLFALSGTSLGRVKMPEGFLNWNLHWYDQTTIFDRLNQKQIPWKVYYNDFPLSFLFVHQLEPANAARHHSLNQFFHDAAGKAEDFPAFSLIEPAYFQPHASDDHPPHDILGGQNLLAQVYNSIRANKELWESTLLVVTYDEHGGFYDHVVPPTTVAPDHHTEEFRFDQLGVRVPAVLISPWMANDVFSQTMDHTSFLKFLIDLWGLGPLGARAAIANTFASAFRDVRNDGPEQLFVSGTLAGEPSATVPVPRVAELSGHQGAMVALSHAVETLTNEPAETIVQRLKHALTGPQSQADVAIDRIEKFIASMR